jgi:hypothetical protein
VYSSLASPQLNNFLTSNLIAAFSDHALAVDVWAGPTLPYESDMFAITFGVWIPEFASLDTCKLGYMALQKIKSIPLHLHYMLLRSQSCTQPFKTHLVLCRVHHSARYTAVYSPTGTIPLQDLSLKTVL